MGHSHNDLLRPDLVCSRVKCAAPLTVGAVENVDVGVDVGVTGACDLDEGGGGKHQDVGAGGVLRGAELRRLHVQGGASAKHRPSRHRI